MRGVNAPTCGSASYIVVRSAVADAGRAVPLHQAAGRDRHHHSLLDQVRPCFREAGGVRSSCVRHREIAHFLRNELELELVPQAVRRARRHEKNKAFETFTKRSYEDPGNEVAILLARGILTTRLELRQIRPLVLKLSAAAGIPSPLKFFNLQNFNFLIFVKSHY